ncbi:Abi family protein [Candidatus Parcubacteria bacterium]|nr:Abi family protein [Candidatus Parcubacteria bacterium]
MNYSKQPKTFNEQIELIKSRGLIIDDEERLKKYLINISYYHLSAYFKSFQHSDRFKDGTTFEDVINLYEFDKKLRLLLSDVLERIEKSFKCSVIYNLAINYNRIISP